MFKNHRLGIFLVVLCLIGTFFTACTQPLAESNPTEDNAMASASEAGSEAADVSESAAEEPSTTDSQSGAVYVYLTRHGQTITNVSGRVISGLGSTPLTENGRQVAQYLGIGLADTPFTAAYSSNLFRTYETAQLILEQNETAAKNLEIQQVKNLREPDMGGWEHMPQDEWLEKAELTADMMVGKASVLIEESAKKDRLGESEGWEDFQSRTVAAFTEICENEARNGGGNVLVVAHGGVNKAIANSITHEEMGGLNNCSIVLIKYENGVMELLSYADMSYMEKGKAKVESPEPMEVHLVVSAQTEAESLGRMSNVYDTALTPAGEKSAAEVGKQIGASGFAAVYAGDLWKDVNTAQLIVENSATPFLRVNASIDMRGICTSNLEGEEIKLLPATSDVNPTAKQMIDAYFAVDNFGLAESYETARDRIVPAYKQACGEAYQKGGGAIVIVSPALTHQLVIEELVPNATPASLDSGAVVTLIFDGQNFTMA